LFAIFVQYDRRFYFLPSVRPSFLYSRFDFVFSFSFFIDSHLQANQRRRKATGTALPADPQTLLAVLRATDATAALREKVAAVVAAADLEVRLVGLDAMR
jgi:hypothetical protein